jgi:hypothetical protein
MHACFPRTSLWWRKSWAADEEVSLRTGGGAPDDAHGTSGADEGVIRASHFDPGNHLRAGRKIVGLMAHRRRSLKQLGSGGECKQ